MDAKPQRPSRPQASFSQANNENAIPAIYGMDLRPKTFGAPATRDAQEGLKPNTKRIAFGDVSNVARAFPDTAVHGFKAIANPVKAVSIFPSATGGKENVAQNQNAGLLAPAQRTKTIANVAVTEASSIRFVPAYSGKPQAGPSRQATVVFSDENAVGRAAEISTLNTGRIHKSPRHHKSQPCLKNALDQQVQKKILRRTQSRLPVDRPQANVVVFTDSTTDMPESSAASECEFHDAVDTLCDDTVEVQGNVVLASDVVVNTADTMSTIQAEVAHVVASLQLPEQLPQVPAHLPQAPVRYSASETTVQDERLDFLDEVPGPAPSLSVGESEDTWDDDGDYYDEQGYTTSHSFRSLGDNTTVTILMPKLTAKIQNELDLARSIVESSLTPEDIDDEAWDISMVAEYGEDINNYMKELESRMLPSPYYMDMQTEIQWSMRSVLMEWLIQVHARFSLMPETLFLTVNYIDRFLSSKIVSVNKLQLVGATAIFIAAKYEEIVCPSVQEIVYMVDGGYAVDEVLKAERFMLSMLGFELGWPGPMSFLRRISKADEYDLETRTLAKYFLEVTIMDERFVACPASFLAAGAHCLARLMLHKGDWSVAHTHYSGYTWSQVRPLATAILQCCRNPRMHHAAVFEKYACVKFKKASLFVEEELRLGFSMPPLHTYRYQASMSGSFTESVGSSDGPVRSNPGETLIQV